MDNPLFLTGQPPRFDTVTSEHVVPAMAELLDRAEAALDALEGDTSPTWDGTLGAERAIAMPAMYAWGVVSHLLGVANSPELRAAQEQMQPRVVSFMMRMGQSRPLFEALRTLRAGPAWGELSSERQRVVEKAIHNMRLSGIELEGSERERFNAIQTELAELSTAFSNAVLDSTKAFELLLTEQEQVDGLPASLLSASAQSAAAHGHPDASAETGPWRITLDYPSMGPFLQHSTRGELREKVYRAFVTRASAGECDNGPRIDQTLSLRRSSAELLGYDTFAEISVSQKMAGTVAAVDSLSEQMRTVALERAREDRAEIVAFARETTGDAALELKHWDMSFWSERLREARYSFNDEDLRPYFPFPRVLEGLFDLTQRLFDVTVEAADGTVPVWHADVRYFRLRDSGGNEIATFYLDPYSRPENKRGGAWMNDASERERTTDGELVLPSAYVICNQTPPVGEQPSLMLFREVETLFHEFGHALQHMLTTRDDAQYSGINGVEWDAVELASQFMENFCYHRETISSISAHVETGQPLPAELFDKVVAARNYHSGSAILRQLYFGLMDMELHHRYDPASSETVADVKQRIVSRATVVAPLPEDRFLCSFGHIFAGGYCAGYYSYLWAEVLSADAFGAFEEAGLDADGLGSKAIQETGLRFRDTVLALGGGTHPTEVFKAFRGREPTTDALLRHRGLSA
ncbi:MAG: M3 family metallopeptidase [Planctomycetota bacterium]|jgi:oligopeptidase A|nr:peptidase M3 [Planctomycetota bacterium]MDP6955749.1 M3 family metallopeptidase [Planctomycetota bacterium]